MTDMMPMMAHTNWLVLLVAAAIAFIVGGVWYSPLLFGKAWKAEQRHRKDRDFKNSTAGMIVQALHLIAVGYVVFLVVVSIHGMGGMMMDKTMGSETMEGETMASETMEGETMASETMEGETMASETMEGETMEGEMMMMGGASAASAICGFVILSLMAGLGMVSGGIFMGHSAKFMAINVGQHVLTLAIFAVAATL